MVHQIYKRGFTLVEMLIYLALLLVVSTAAIASLLSFSDAIGYHKAKQEIGRAVIPLLEQVTYDIRQARSVDTLNSLLGVDDSELRLTNTLDTTIYDVAGGALRLQKSGETMYLTTSAVTVDAFRVYAYDNTSTELVRVELELSVSYGSGVYSETFYTSSILRGSYD